MKRIKSNKTYVRVINTYYKVKGNSVQCTIEADFDFYRKDLPILDEMFDNKKLKKVLGGGVSINNKGYVITGGKATCDKEDTFNLEIGKKIAKSKAMKALFIAKAGFYGWYISKLCRVLDKVHPLTRNCYKAAQQEDSNIVNIYNYYTEGLADEDNY